MKTIDGYKFPEYEDGPEVIKEWKPDLVVRALASTALCVAQTRIEGAWSAYCKGVPGMDHREEQHEVLKTGDKLSEDLARAIFPYFENIPYAL